MSNKSQEMTWLITVCVLISVLAGCAAKSLQKDFVFSNEGSDGIVVVSVSHDLPGKRAASAIFYMTAG